MKHILTHSPFAEISILGDFNVHHQLWLSSSFTNLPGENAYNFALLNDLEQLVQHPTRIPDRLGDRPNILDLFHTAPDIKIKFDNISIFPSTHVKNLGVVMDCHLSFDVHIHEMHKKSWVTYYS